MGLSVCECSLVYFPVSGSHFIKVNGSLFLFDIMGFSNMGTNMIYEEEGSH